MGSLRGIVVAERSMYIAVLAYGGDLYVSPPFYVLVPHDDGRVIDWDGALKSLTGLAKAYTRNGFLLERGRYPWGNEDRVFIFSETVLQSLVSFQERKDLEGFYEYCNQLDLVSFSGDSL